MKIIEKKKLQGSSSVCKRDSSSKREVETEREREEECVVQASVQSERERALASERGSHNAQREQQIKNVA